MAKSHFWAIRDVALLIANDFMKSEVWKSDIKPALSKINNTLTEHRDVSFYAIIGKLRKAAQHYDSMLKINKKLSGGTEDLPSQNALAQLIERGKISIISLEGYSDELRQSIVGMAINQLINERVDDNIPRFLTVIEEAHNFIPSRSESSLVMSPSLPVLKRVATEGRKYGMGLILISQRPSRVDATILSQCNWSIR